MMLEERIMIETIIEQEEAYPKDAEELLREAQDYMKERRKKLPTYNHEDQMGYSKYYKPSFNKQGLMQTINYIAEMEQTLEKQGELLAAQEARSNDDIFEEKNKKIEELQTSLSEAHGYQHRSMDMDKANEIMNWYYTHILEEGGNIKGHKLKFSMYYGPLGCCRLCVCDCGAEYEFGDEEKW